MRYCPENGYLLFSGSILYFSSKYYEKSRRNINIKNSWKNRIVIAKRVQEVLKLKEQRC